MGSHQPRRHRYILIRKLTHWACVAYLLSIPSIFELDLHFVPNYTSAKFHACLSNGCNAIVLHFADSAEKKHNNTCQSTSTGRHLYVGPHYTNPISYAAQETDSHHGGTCHIHLSRKSEMAKNVNISALDENISTEFGGQLHHGHVATSRRPHERTSKPKAHSRHVIRLLA